jgi:alpha-beta hydrolase superfamily lysophospholipase
VNETLKVPWNVLISALFIYTVVALILFIFQRQLLYYPSNFKPSKELIDVEKLRYWPSYDNYRGFTGAEELSDPDGTVIVFHGNAGTAYHRAFYIDALSRQNLRVILAEYPGYGGREDKPTEAKLVGDAVETLRLAHQAYGEPLYLWGESLGSGVASGVVAQTKVPLKALVLFLPWDSLSNLAQTHYWYLPARWLVLDQYNNVENLLRYQGNVAVMLAGMDEVVPAKHGRKLYESIDTNKKLWIFEGVSHNSIPVAPNLSWWKEIKNFISQ